MTRFNVACEILALDNRKSRSKGMLNYLAFLTSLLSDFIWVFAHIHIILGSEELDFVSFPSRFPISALFWLLHSSCIRGLVYVSFYFLFCLIL